jgi:RNA polymerase sigma-70 factor (ECF subfamily)
MDRRARSEMDGAVVLETSGAGSDLESRFGSLVDSHRDRALRLAWRLVGGDEAAAEDVTQEAFLKAYRGLQQFREEAALETWFYRILVRQAHSYRRWRAVREFWNAGAIGDPPDPSPNAVGDPALRRRIAAALDRLTRSQREAFVLVHLEGFRVRECADVLAKPIGTVKSHLHRALASLRRELADLRDPEAIPDEENAK